MRRRLKEGLKEQEKNIVSRPPRRGPDKLRLVFNSGPPGPAHQPRTFRVEFYSTSAVKGGRRYTRQSSEEKRFF